MSDISLMNVSYYDSKAEYIRLSFMDVKTDEEAAEVFSDKLESGFIQDITCGTYNGATDDFTPWEFTDNNILDTIFNELHEADFYEFVTQYEEDENALNDWTNADWIREYTEVYEVFIIGNNVYVNMDQ